MVIATVRTNQMNLYKFAKVKYIYNNKGTNLVDFQKNTWAASERDMIYYVQVVLALRILHRR